MILPFAQTNVPSASDNLFESFFYLRDRLIRLLEASQIRDRGFNQPGDPIVVVGAQYDWVDLGGEALILQRDMLKEWGTLREIVSFYAKDMPNSISWDIEEACKTIDYLIRQEDLVWSGNKQDLVDDGTKAVNDIVSGFKKFSDDRVGSVMLVPDTNALLWQPDFTDYNLHERKVELILIPAVLSELDQAKIHKNESVRKKTEKIIRQVKEFRRRGNLNNGVTVVKDKISIRSVAIEPNMQECLGWFDPDNKDDRILASTLEIIRNNLGTPVAIITRDMNLENKAELARVPYIEPPSPS